MNKQNFGRKISQINVIQVLVTFLCASMCAAPFQYHSRHPRPLRRGWRLCRKIKFPIHLAISELVCNFAAK